MYLTAATQICCILFGGRSFVREKTGLY